MSSSPQNPFSFLSTLAPLARLALVASGAGLMVSSSLAATTQKNAASKNDQAQEYIQARKIALKDPGVQSAYSKADEKLDDRIMEIDPSLKPYVEKRRAKATTAALAASATPAPVVKQPVAAKAVSSDGTHVVLKGETLSSIALQYKVSVSSLKSANNITDERKLRAGQKLIIPAAKTTSAETKSTPAATPAGTKSEPSLWDRLQNSF
jgi:LysM repeat protein